MSDTNTIRIAWFGDIVGKAGRVAGANAVKVLRASPNPPHLIVADAENARHGRGLHPEGFEELRAAGMDLLTLGDHALDDPRILPILKDPGAPVMAPINMDLGADGAGVKRRWVVTLPPNPNSDPNPSSNPQSVIGGANPPLVFLTVLGRIFMRTEFPDPFAALDAAMESISQDHPGAIVLLEVHAEATSEKQAIAWHARLKWGNDAIARPQPHPGGMAARVPEGQLCPDPTRARIVSVVGSHTHVQTSDARLLDDQVAVLTDLGMTGSSRSVIGFLIEGSIARLKTPPSGGLDVAEENPIAHGAMIEIDVAERRPISIETIRIPV